MSRIVVFDSGVGGLSVYQEIVKKCPNHDYVFVSDNLAFPYGTKSESELTERVLSVAHVIEQQYKPDLLVVACNTASTVVLSSLRSRFTFPIVGVVPAIKPAAKLSKTKTIGLLATPGTVSRGYTQELINKFAADCHVIKVGSSKLVEIAERKLYGFSVDINQIEKELTLLLKTKNLDVLVLACTHFPLLNKEIDCIFKEKNNVVFLIDSGQAIANRVAELCLDNDEGSSNKKIAAFTKEKTSNTLKLYLNKLGFNSIELLGESRGELYL